AAGRAAQNHLHEISLGRESLLDLLAVAHVPDEPAQAGEPAPGVEDGRRDDLDGEGGGARAHEQRLPRLDLARAAPQEPVQMAEEARPGLLARDLRRRLSPVRPSGELLSALAQDLELLGERVLEHACGRLHAHAEVAAPARTRSTTACAATEPGPAFARRMPRSCSMRSG